VLLDYLAWRGGGGVAGNTWISNHSKDFPLL
jgi:hypothetical protein